VIHLKIYINTADYFCKKEIIMKNLFLFFLVVTVILSACEESPEKKALKEKAARTAESNILEQEIGEKARAIFKAMPAVAENAENKITPEKVKLGKILYFDTQLSNDNTQSCNTCHDLGKFGVDNLQFSIGVDGKPGTRNSPTVINAALHTTQFWDGRSPDVEDQAGGPILNPVEMDMPNERAVVDRIQKSDMYQKLFAQAFPSAKNPITFKNITLAIGAFERTLIFPSRFDDYIKGKATALTLEEKKGLKEFMDAQCTTCHIGSLLGGNMFQKFGLMGNYRDFTGNKENTDQGRYEETKQENDKDMFKVPSLRNAAETGPYFHDGSVKTLDEAIHIMSMINFKKELSDDQINSIKTFISALSTPVPEEIAKMPEELE
jgi:cytochrome c peroxidase